MANPIASIILTAVDKTKAAFASVLTGFDKLKSKGVELRDNFGLLFGVGLSAAGFIATIKSAVDAMDSASKSAQKIGTSVENFSALTYAASQSDIPVETLEKSLLKLARTADDAKSGLQTALDPFQRLKIDPKQFKDPADLLVVIADRFAAMPDGINKAALAQQLFGKSGAEMIPMLNGGSAGIRELTDEAAKLGVVFSTEAAKAAETFNDNLDKLKTAGKGLGVSLAQDILPGLTQITEAMTTAAKDGGILKAAWVGLGGFGAALFTDQFKALDQQIAEKKAQLARATTGFFTDSNAAARLRTEIAALEEQAAREKQVNADRRKDSKDTSDEIGKNRKAEQDAFRKSTNEQIADAQRLNSALQSAFEGSIRAEEDYLRQAKKLRDEANGTTPVPGDVQSQASANFDAITKAMQLQREAGTASLQSVQDQSAALQQLAGQLDDQALKNDLIKQAKLAEAAALEKAAAEEKLRYQDLSKIQADTAAGIDHMKAALEGLGKEVSVDIKPGAQLDATLAKMREIKSLIEFLQNTPVSVNVSNAEGTPDALNKAALKFGSR
jgi:hypothetical protein